MIEKVYKVYVYTNKINGKKYVGQTKQTLKLRAGASGCNYKRCTYFYRAIQKYGWENFESEIVYDGLSKNEANIYEIQLIRDLQTTNIQYGYNIASGGDGANIEEFKKPVVQFDLYFNYIQRYNSMTEASIENNIDKSHIGDACNHSFNQSGGFIWLFESDYLSNNYNKEEMLYALHKEYEHPFEKSVVQCDLNMNYINTYKNMGNASKHTGVRRGSISDNCNHKLKTAGGYIWMFESEYKNIDKKEIDNIVYNANNHNTKTKKPVIQYDLNMNYINEFNSILEASKHTGIHRSMIRLVCEGKYKQANCYIWRYA